MIRRTFIKTTGAAGIFSLISPRSIFQSMTVREAHWLEKRFLTPLVSDQPQVMWFWMNGHISKEGITQDLEAMKRVGVGGVFNFDAGIGIPKGPVEYLSPEWLELKQHAIEEAQRLNLEFTMHNCPGWSSSGGPWITPELAMQQLTWSELITSGGQSINKKLPIPFHQLNDYQDVAVLAYPSLPGEIATHDFTIQSANGTVPIEKFTGEDAEGIMVHPEGEKKTAWLQIQFKAPTEIRLITFLISSVNMQNYEPGRTAVLLESSQDGTSFNTVATISTGLEEELLAGDKLITYDINPVKARYFRLSSNASRRYTQVRFSGITRLPNFLEKTGNRFMFSGAKTSPVYQSEQSIAHASIEPGAILDISRYMDKEGKLKWDAPKGNWTILRFGHSAINTFNKAAPDKGTGLECDKFSKEAIDYHFREILRHMIPVTRMTARGKLGLEIDSYEAGPQTWTKNFPREFQARRHYALTKYLPAITGRIIQDVNYTERFLWDFRKTQADLIAENYYGRFTENCHKHNMTSYIQPYDKGPFDEMQIGATADVNLGEHWYGLSSILQGNLSVRRTSKMAASIAHTNGRKIVGAEAFTSEPASSRWQEYPFALKALGDSLFTMGINKMVIHRFAHQPNVWAKPGMTMGPWGIHFDRTNTWFEYSKDWLQYMSRCQAMLQQGLPVNDLAYLTAEDANLYSSNDRFGLEPVPPVGYDYDLIHANTILKKAKIINGWIMLPDGMRYRMLVLQHYKGMTLQLLMKLKELVGRGMVVLGKKPEHSLGLQGFTDDSRFKNIRDELWGSIDGVNIVQNKYGKGCVYYGTSMEQTLQQIALQPDLQFSSRSGDAPLQYIHRSIGLMNTYFICNQRRTYEDIVVSFRIKDQQPEIWDAATGRIMPAPVYETDEDRVRMPLQLDPYGSVFIVFRTAATSNRLIRITKEAESIGGTKHFPERPRKRFSNIINQFSITLWAKPEMNIMTGPSIHMGNVKHPYTDFYAMYPSPGKTLYGEGHATCGLAIGRNGIAVWENEVYPILVLFAKNPISGWCHVTLIYDHGIPSVYVDGKMIAKGNQSDKIIHPGVGENDVHEGASYYNGDLGVPLVYQEILTPENIRQLAVARHPDPPLPKAEIAGYNNKPGMLLFQKGTYSMHKKSGEVESFTVMDINEPLDLSKNWEVQFLLDQGMPLSIHLPELISWHRMDTPVIKYFSGTAIYAKQFEMIAINSKSQRLIVDLGSLEVVAELKINNQNMGVLWKRPYRVDITQAVKTGLNNIEIKVTNLWPNRLIGDEQEPDPDQFALAGSNGFEQLTGSGIENSIGQPIRQLPAWFVNGEHQPRNGRTTFTTWKHFTKEDPLLESGLVGPVAIYFAVWKPI